MIGRQLGKRFVFALLASAGLYACFGGSDREPGDVPAFDGIADGELITAVGNEPFWNAVVDGDRLTYSTPENLDGDMISVTRFAGNGGLGISGDLHGQSFDMAITPGECSDTMSDRSYPFTVTLTIGDELRYGCAYTASQMYSGGEGEG